MQKVIYFKTLGSMLKAHRLGNVPKGAITSVIINPPIKKKRSKK